MLSKKELINFELELAREYDDGKYPYLVHFSGGNEDNLIDIFKNIHHGDYIFSTHRSHYHYLLAGGGQDKLKHLISIGKSMFVFDRSLNFYSSSILAGTAAIAVGVAWALKRKKSNRRVWCFIGDGGADEGHFYEAARYVDGWDLPCTFILEDNDRSVSSSKKDRWNRFISINFSCVKTYSYTPTWPHGGTGSGKWMKFKTEPIVENDPIKKEFKYIKENISISHKDAISLSMEKLSKLGYIFVGYNVKYGSGYGTLKNVSDDQKIETPVAENLMAGLAAGMTLEGFRSVLFFERQDFIYNALDILVNQVDKIGILSNGEFNFPIIIRGVIGSINPFYAGITHTSDLTSLLDKMFSFPVIKPMTSGDIIGVYNEVERYDNPIFISEIKEKYETIA